MTTVATTDDQRLPGRMSPGRLPAIRLLIVDGFPLMREGLAVALDQPPIMVVGDADHGPDAVERAVELAPDVVLIDTAGPGFGGPAGIADLQALLPDTRFVALGVDDGVESVRAVLAAGAAGYLSRRAGVDEIRRAIVAARAGEAAAAQEAAAPSAADPWPPLSAREQEVLDLIVQGLTDREIGDRLAISARTVHNHLERIREKTGLRRRAQLSGWATERRIAAEAPGRAGAAGDPRE